MLAVLLSVFVGFHPSSAADYHVATSGNDGAPGSRQQPFRSIARALAVASDPGDSVIVRRGTYPQQRPLYVGNSGAAGKLITLRAEKGEEVIIDGTGTPEGSALILVNAHHVRIEGLTLRNAKDNGITIWGPGSRIHHVEVVGNTISRCYKSGIYTANNRPADPVSDILIEGNTVYDCVLMNERREKFSWAFGLGAGPSRRVTIRNNTVYRNHGEGIGFYLSDQGVAEGNVVYDNFSVNLYLDNATRMRVERNFVYSTGDRTFFRFSQPAAGIQIANENYPFSNPSSDNVIVNNILVGNLNGISYANYQAGGGLRNTLIAHNTCYGATGSVLKIQPDRGHRNSRIVNNIFVAVDGGRITEVGESLPGVEFGSNLWFGGTPQESVRGKGDVFRDPLFVKAGAVDPQGYQIRKGSVAVGKGVRLKQSDRDFSGQTRGARTTLGAREAR